MMQKSDGFLVTQNPSDFSYPKIRRIFGHPKSVGFLVSQNPTDFGPPKIRRILGHQKSVVFFGGWIPKISKFGTLRLGLGWGN